MVRALISTGALAVLATKNTHTHTHTHTHTQYTHTHGHAERERERERENHARLGGLLKPLDAPELVQPGLLDTRASLLLLFYALALCVDLYSLLYSQSGFFCVGECFWDAHVRLRRRELVAW